jgi:hypothetical protein
VIDSIDPKLSQALAENAPSLNVFFKLIPIPGMEPSVQAERLIDSVRKNAGLQMRYHFRDLDQVLQVMAPASIISQLLLNSQVGRANLVPAFDTALIAPLNPRLVD